MINVKFERWGGALLIRVNGYFQVKTALRVRDMTNLELDRAHAVKALLDLRKSVWLMNDDEWQLLSQQLAIEPIQAAMGVLGSELDSPNIWRACLAIMKSGRTRVPFTSPAHAAEWLGVPLQAVSPHREFQPAQPVGFPPRDASAE